MNLQLIRYCYGPDCVLGLLKVGEGNQQMNLWTVERPWQNNAVFVSCIPDGEYGLLAFDSKSHPPSDGCWVITPVPGRTGILIHPGNSVDDVQGCIAPGQRREGEKVYNSRAAMRMLNFVMNRNEQHTIQIGSGLGAQLMSDQPVDPVPGEGDGNNGGGELRDIGGEKSRRTAYRAPGDSD